MEVFHFPLFIVFRDYLVVFCLFLYWALFIFLYLYFFFIFVLIFLCFSLPPYFLNCFSRPLIIFFLLLFSVIVNFCFCFRSSFRLPMPQFFHIKSLFFNILFFFFSSAFFLFKSFNVLLGFHLSSSLFLTLFKFFHISFPFFFLSVSDILLHIVSYFFLFHFRFFFSLTIIFTYL